MKTLEAILRMLTQQARLSGKDGGIEPTYMLIALFDQALELAEIGPSSSRDAPTQRVLLEAWDV